MFSITTDNLRPNNRDPTETIHNKMNRMGENMFLVGKKQKMEEQQNDWGDMSVQVHKDGVPIRPVVSYVGYFEKCIVGKEKSSVKNSYELVVDLKNIRIQDSYGTTESQI